MTDRIALDALNRLDDAGFVAALGGVFENAPWVAEAVLPGRPYGSLAFLHAAMSAAVRDAPAERRLALLRGHPDLAGKAARAGAMTDESKAEQAGAGLDRLTEAEYDRFHELNAAYQAKFGFPFIVCVRRHGKESILRSFERRLAHTPEQELAAALEEVLRIGALRIDQKVTAADRLPLAGRLSTHVLDTHRGRPAAGVEIELFELWGEERRPVARGVTNADGRTDAPLISGRPVPIARYELRFGLGDYFAGLGVALADPPFLDVVPIRFAVGEPEGHYHVPLLATPWGYTTYRGS
ncbi:2-oxo-4-hydroxy-4-carboxy-5-ureidoimidazoline decarboxylase [Thalassobaculum sp.]|uniref:2-oxo-4-hydroxy-4-carboxy-5-ureidoimidazoline decarboxylase n=1 Tax=Thalassobaculum sp. TaxID=2022740 RepID=UPI0032EB0444